MRRRVFLLSGLVVFAGLRVAAWGDEPKTPAVAEKVAEPKFKVESNIVYSKAGGKELLLDAYVPTGKGPFPAILVIHGGAWRSGNKAQLMRYAQMLAARGYSAFAINYRLAPDHQYPAQIEDCRAAVKWIRDHASKYKVDPDRVGAIGYSAGGHLASLLAVEGDIHPECRIQAAVAGGAPVDFRNLATTSKAVRDLIGGTKEEKAKEYADASPATHVNKGDAPIFFYHGTADELVGVENVEKMVGALKDVEVTAELYLVKDAKHVPAAMNLAAVEEAIKFFDRHLKNGKAEVAGN